MYLDELIENESEQSNGKIFYPKDEFNDKSYMIIRRAGTLEHKRFKSRQARNYPPNELLTKEKIEEKAHEMLIEEVRDYLLVDMVGFLNKEDDSIVNYKKSKNQIICGDKCLSILNYVVSKAYSDNGWAREKNLTFKKALEKYINVNIIEEADDQDWLALWHSAGEEEYKKIRGELTPEQSAILHVYFDLKRDARGELVTRKQAYEAALSVDYDFDDTVDIILHIDDYYTKRQNEKLAAKAEAQQKAKR